MISALHGPAAAPQPVIHDSRNPNTDSGKMLASPERNAVGFGRRGDSMPTGSRGERRPGDVIGAAVMVAKIATRAISASAQQKSVARGGNAAAADRNKKLTPAKRRRIARKASAARWG